MREIICYYDNHHFSQRKSIYEIRRVNEPLNRQLSTEYFGGYLNFFDFFFACFLKYFLKRKLCFSASIFSLNLAEP